MKSLRLALIAAATIALSQTAAWQSGAGPAAPLRIALVKQPFIPNGVSVGPTTMASGGIQANWRSSARVCA
jgi:hypothetical protein